MGIIGNQFIILNIAKAKNWMFRHEQLFIRYEIFNIVYPN